MKFFDTFFPSFSCLVCSEEINNSKNFMVCDKCAARLPLHKNVCAKCGCEILKNSNFCDRCKPLGAKVTAHQKLVQKQKWNFTKARSPFEYKKPVKNLILRLKYGAVGDVAAFAAPFLAQTLEAHKIVADIIIPVPLSPKRQKQRGYNQSQLIADQLSKLTGIQVLPDFLIRTKNTRAQRNMNIHQRQKNLHNAFDVTAPFDRIKGKRIILLDDVFTTGTTVDQCSLVLKKYKPKSINVLTIASVSKI